MEGRRFHNTKEMFDSAYTLIKKSNYQFRRLMLCLKVTNNATNSCRSYQSLYAFIQLSLINTTIEPKRLLKNKYDLTNNLIHVKKKRICLDCKRFLDLEILGHRASNKKCLLFFLDWCFVTWDLSKKYVFEIYGNIYDQNTSLHSSIKIKNG